ncbi:MAG: hypothetical protein ACPIOQ_80370 [Promethearchaeia archaeon]
MCSTLRTPCTALVTPPRPLRYIRTGNYARILAQEALNEPSMNTAAQRKLEKERKDAQEYASLGLRG